jgi:hypothetical protein
MDFLSILKQKVNSALKKLGREQDEYVNLDESSDSAEDSNAGQLLSSSTPLSDEEAQVVTIHTPKQEETITKIFDYLEARQTKIQSGNFTGQFNRSVKASAELETISKGLKHLVNLNIIAESTLELQGQYASKYATFTGTLGAYANAKATFNVNFMDIKAGILIDASASASASVEVTANVSVQSRVFQIGELGAQASAFAEAYASAEASVEGRLKITSKGIAIKGEVKAGASAGIGIEGNAEITLKGKKVFGISASAGVAVGAEVELGGSFTYENGVLTINIKAGAVALVGGSVDTTVEINYEAIKELISEALAEQAEILKAKINVYLREKMDLIIAELEAAGDDTERLLDATHIDSELYSEDENVNLEFLRANKTSRSAWEKLKRVKKAGPNRKLVAYQEVIEIAIKLTDKKQP